jgi:hypothetical protein
MSWRDYAVIPTTNYCGLNQQMRSKLKGALDHYCRQHDRRYSELSRRGRSPYTSYNWADRMMYSQVMRLRPSAERTAVLAFLRTKRLTMPHDLADDSDELPSNMLGNHHKRQKTIDWSQIKKRHPPSRSPAPSRRNLPLISDGSEEKMSLAVKEGNKIDKEIEKELKSSATPDTLNGHHFKLMHCHVPHGTEGGVRYKYFTFRSTFGTVTTHPLQTAYIPCVDLMFGFNTDTNAVPTVAAAGTSYVMANQQAVYFDPAVHYWKKDNAGNLTSKPSDAVSGFGNLDTYWICSDVFMFKNNSPTTVFAEFQTYQYTHNETTDDPMVFIGNDICDQLNITTSSVAFDNPNFNYLTHKLKNAPPFRRSYVVRRNLKPGQSACIRISTRFRVNIENLQQFGDRFHTGSYGLLYRIHGDLGNNGQGNVAYEKCWLDFTHSQHAYMCFKPVITQKKLITYQNYYNAADVKNENVDAPGLPN